MLSWYLCKMPLIDANMQIFMQNLWKTMKPRLNLILTKTVFKSYIKASRTYPLHDNHWVLFLQFLFNTFFHVLSLSEMMEWNLKKKNLIVEDVYNTLHLSLGVLKLRYYPMGNCKKQLGMFFCNETKMRFLNKTN